MAVGGEPARRLCRDRAEHLQAVPAAVERGPRLVVTRLGGQESDLFARHVGGVADQDADPATQALRQRTEQVALVHLPAGRLDIAPGAPDGGRVEVGGVQFRRAPPRPAQSRGGGQAERAGAAAQVDNHRVVGRERDRGLDEELASAPGDEHAGVHEDAQTAEIRPADDLLERQAGGALRDHRVQFGGRVRGVCEQPGLLFGEHASGSPQPRDDAGIG